MTPIEKRHAATQATLDRFRDRSFRWGSVDCARMASFHLKRAGVKIAVAKAGSYRSAASAVAALKRLGHADLVSAMDATGLLRIAPAAAMIGDVVSFDADHPIGALGIVVGNGNMLAFHESAETPVIMTMGRINCAWQVI